MGRSIVVVGAGLAGLGAARALREQGFDGRLVLIGREPHAPYDRPPLSKEFLAGRLPVAALGLAAPQDADLDLDVRLGEQAVALHPGERTVELASGERVGGAGVVVATGARARDLRTAPDQPRLTGVHRLRTLDDALALRAELGSGVVLVVVGGGFIGAEVTVVDVDPVPLSGVLGPEAARFCADQHAAHGTRLRTGVPVVGLDGDRGRVCGVRLADGRRIAADLVVVGIGSAPDVGWLAGSGLDAEGGIRTDAGGGTGVPGVVATGDCTRRYEPAAGAVVRQEHWTNALLHPQLAAATLLGGPPPVQQVGARLPYVWSEQYGTRLQFAGHHRPGDVFELLEGDPSGGAFAGVYRRDGREVAVVAVDSQRVFTRRRRALAASLAGVAADPPG